MQDRFAEPLSPPANGEPDRRVDRRNDILEYLEYHITEQSGSNDICQVMTGKNPCNEEASFPKLENRIHDKVLQKEK